MRFGIFLAALAFAIAVATGSAGAQQATQPGASGASGAGQMNTGQSAGDMQRANPPTTSNDPRAHGGANTGSDVGAPSTATSKGRPEVPRSDSRR